MTMTLAAAEATYGLTHDDHLDRDLTIPTVRRIAAQGDVLILRTRRSPATAPVPPAGFPVVRGENGGHTHLLIGDAAYDTDRTPDTTGLLLGVATVPQGGTCLLSHPEHGSLLLAPGTYELRRQREQADQIRLVQD